MSRIGTQPVILPAGVELTLVDSIIKIKGPKGELEVVLPEGITLEQADQSATFVRDSNERRAIHGTVRSLLDNAVKGVSEGWSKSLEIVGSGYRAAVNGSDLDMAMGYSHPVKLTVPEGLKAEVVKNTITVSGIDRQAVGQFAAIIRAVRKPEPYKGKGIRYEGEHVRRKAGKALKSGA
jgi:large subunit ribosomal protein L6